ncbi:MAG: aminotransferase class III-fold pyridoxal phosphate-dependent enzyme [Candidatus Marinimicrobia bacterium]|nr:aminotransferase class III-fold pyridoxal phosphate-dependent enzyme [Candidatus Neomarinimicrobiota bacterium]
MKPSMEKAAALAAFGDHVSSGKAAFFKKYRMDFIMGRREGAYLWDIDGKTRLFNLHCNGGVFNLGHRHAELIELLKSSLDDVDIGNHHLMSRHRAELAQQLAELMPGDLTYTVFGVGGGEAVDLAFKVARSYTGRAEIISAIGGYHGHTGLALAAGDEKYRKPFGPSSPGFIQVPFGEISAIENALSTDTAAVILETIPATLGMPIPRLSYLAEVRRLCKENNTLLIMDEVQTGLGRTGKLWGFQHYHIVPDIVVLGKGLSGGVYPITATVIRKPLESVFHEDPFIHISTFGGSEIGCKVAQRVLEISSAPAFLEHVNHLAEAFKSGVAELQQKHGKFLKGLRQLGLMMGLELVDELAGFALTKAAYDHDLLMIYANNDTRICQLLPPLTMHAGQVTEVMTQLDKALTSAARLHKLMRLKRWLSRGSD